MTNLNTKNMNNKELSNRTFGLIFAGIFLLIALFPLLKNNNLRSWALIVCALFLFSSLIVPKVLTPLNKTWVKFGQLMHTITNPILMGLVFFFTVFPTGLALKVLGKDPMRRKKEPNSQSYWIDRNPDEISADSFNQQF